MGALLFNTLLWGETHSHDHKIWAQETRNIALSCGAMHFDILSRLGVDTCDGRTDRTAFSNSAV